MSVNRIDWEDLRHVLAVADAASLAAAARALGVNHTTVLRRVNAFEARFGVRLFDRLPSGYALTAAGEELLVTARGLAEEVAALERRLEGRDLRLEGRLRVTTTDTLMASLLPRQLAAFADEHPGIVAEVTLSNAMADLARRDADVALRPAADPPETLFGRRVSGIAFAAYAAPAYLARRPGQSLASHRWLAPDESLAGTTVARWMRRTLPDAAVVLRSDSLVALRDAALAGIGAVALPCYLGDTSPGLVRLGAEIAADGAALWILTHEDLRRTARVAAFTEFLFRRLSAEIDLVEGRRPLPPQ